MKKNKGMQLGAILAAMLMVSIAFAAGVSAESADTNISDNVILQKEKLPDN
jgi:hypothetical protein